MHTKKMLIVEDLEELRESLKEYLVSANLVVDIAKNGLDALRKSSIDKYDIITTDIDMPMMNGLDFIRSIKKTKEVNFETPIIIFSAKVMDIIDEDVVRHHKIKCFSKPSDLFHLKQYIIEILQKGSGESILTT